MIVMITASTNAAATRVSYDEDLSPLSFESDKESELADASKGVVVGILLAVGIVKSEPMSVGQK